MGEIIALRDDAAVAIGNLYRSGMETWREVGARLIAEKGGMAHGEWLPWLADNEKTLGFKHRTADRLMALANSSPGDEFDLWGHAVRGTQGTGENEWYTPEIYIIAAREVLGGIDLDPATSEAAQSRIQATQFFTQGDDGLSKEWHGRVWLNPPYAQPLIADFIDKLLLEINCGHVTAAILLTHNYTDTAWFHSAASQAKAICFTRGRVKFEGPGGAVAAPTQGQAFSYFGKHAQKFSSCFRHFGFVVRP
jgi:phage N-6-adenine-methyltransferase